MRAIGSCRESRRSSPVSMRSVAPSSFHRVTYQLTIAAAATITGSATSYQRGPALLPTTPEADSPASVSTASTARPDRIKGDSGCRRRQPWSVFIGFLAGASLGRPGGAQVDTGELVLGAGRRGRQGLAAFGPAPAAATLPPLPPLQWTES